jgi:uncharacterized protein YcfL
MKKEAIFILIIAAVLISGCAQSRPVNSNENRGVTINSFSASPIKVFSGEQVLFDAEIENIGGTTATNVRADLYGVEGQWYDSMGNPVDSSLTKLGETRLKPPVPDRNIPGDFRIVQWQLTTPDFPQGISDQNVRVDLRVTYDYNTSGYMNVRLMSLDEWRRRQTNEQDVSNPDVLVNSNGPIKLSLARDYKDSLIIDNSADGEAVQILPFKIQIDNVGDGYPITEEEGGLIGAGGRLGGTIDLYGPAGIEFDECLGVAGGKHIELDDANIIVRLRESVNHGSVPITCTVRVDKDLWGNRFNDYVQLIFNLKYKYYVDESVHVIVSGV